MAEIVESDPLKSMLARHGFSLDHVECRCGDGYLDPVTVAFRARLAEIFARKNAELDQIWRRIEKNQRRWKRRRRVLVFFQFLGLFR